MRSPGWDFKFLNYSITKSPNYKIRTGASRLAVSRLKTVELSLDWTGEGARPHAGLALRGLARGLRLLAFQRLFAAHVDFDLLGLGFGLLGQLDFQHALFVVSADAVGVYRVR